MLLVSRCRTSVKRTESAVSANHPPYDPHHHRNTGLLAALQIPHSLGFVGGKPNHAIYFVGNRGTELVGPDPHTVQQAPEAPPPLVAAQQQEEARTRTTILRR